MLILSKKSVDIIISFAVMAQSLLVVLQVVMIAVFNVSEDTSTNYREVLTIFTMGLAILLSLIRKPLRFIVTYAITVCILLLHSVIFPNNFQYIWSDSLRFLLPVVIPSALCITCVNNFHAIEKALYYISWGCFILVIFFIFNFFYGHITFLKYDMGFSYALLLPTLFLYSKKKWYSVIAAFILFIAILTFGSRGAVLFFILYVCYDMVIKRKRAIFFLAGATLIFIAILPNFLDILNDVGVSSRTLNLLLAGEITQDSGRMNIYSKIKEAIAEYPLFGLGVWGDRNLLGGAYSHNLILEIYIDWGIILASILLLIFVATLLNAYFKSSDKNRDKIIMYFIPSVLPLLLSSSYLINYLFSTFIGILYLFQTQERSKEFYS